MRVFFCTRKSTFTFTHSLFTAQVHERFDATWRTRRRSCLPFKRKSPQCSKLRAGLEMGLECVLIGLFGFAFGFALFAFSFTEGAHLVWGDVAIAVAINRFEVL